jgi:UDP-glucose 4-epimerase
MRFLVTGGAGFIGSHLCEALLEKGHRVRVLDDLSTGSMDNNRHLKEHPGFRYTIDSAGNSTLVAELVDEADVVYHLAAAVGVDLIVESPVRTIETNVHCTEVVLAHANKKKKPVVIASTSEVYGKSTALPFSEDGDMTFGTSTVGRWAYACSKALDEFLAIAYYKERKLPTTVVRLFNTVGPRQTGRYGMVLPRFVRQAVADQPLSVFGDGTQTRCFCHVADVVDGLLRLLDHETSGQVFNIGSTEEISMLDLAHRVVGLAASASDIQLVPYEEAFEAGYEDMERRVPDIRKIGALTGWEPTRTLDEIVADVIGAHREALVV